MKQLFNNINNKKKAFTLIELLIVIAIIGILSGAVIVAMSGTQESAIDSRIKASMAQLRSSIEIYGLVNGANYTGLESDSEISLLIDDIESQVGTPTVNISGSGDRYCLSTNLKSSNELWCIDSAGFAGLGGCINYSCDTSLGYSSGGIPISTGLVGYWTMDEDSLLSSNTIRDYSPYGNTGTIYGATFTTDRKGKANSAMSFDGVNDYIDCGTPIIPAGDFSISAWCYNKGVISDYNSICGQYKAGQKGRMWFGFQKSAFGYRIGEETETVSVEYNKHLHCVITREGTTVKVYLNGNLVITRTAADSIYQGANTIIGSYDSTAGRFNGSIDDVRIYNRALSAEEITFLYNSSR